MKKKRQHTPKASVRKLQTFFNETLLYSDDAFPMGEIYEMGTDGIYRQTNNQKI